MASSIFLNPAMGISVSGGAIAFSGSLTTTLPALGTTSTDGLVLQNNTPATAGVTVQISPRASFIGAGYNSVSTLSETSAFYWENAPTTQAGTTVSVMRLGYTLNAGAPVFPLTINSAGQLTSLQGYTLAAQASIGWNIGFLTGGTATGLFQLRNANVTAGVGWDVNTDAVFKIRTTAQTGYATVDALGYKVSGTAGANFGPSAVASITVVGGLITAIS